MKRLFFIFFLTARLWFTVYADEGMWTLCDLPGAVYERMVGEGCLLTPGDLYGGEGSLMGAVVNFSGYCSGVVVSGDGLVFTNHHCGFEAIRSHSSVDRDYMTDGFYAPTEADELPNEGMYVSFMVSQRDITPMLDSLGFSDAGEHDRALLVDSIEDVLSRQARDRDSTLTVEVLPFYSGNRYYATAYRTFTDVRLVFAPPAAMGKFGGDTDNWMWPRQTCDFSVFRIYADRRTNGPADYDQSNIPYHPRRRAKVSMDGYREGDFVMTIGYPGGTERYLSSYGIEQMRDCRNAPIAQERGVKLKVWREYMDRSPAIRIMYDSKYAQTSNYWKNFIGMNRCIDSLRLIERKGDYEKEIAMALRSDSASRLDFSLLRRLYERMNADYRALTYLSDSFSDIELVNRAKKVYNYSMIVNPDDREDKQYVMFDDNSGEWDLDTDRATLKAMLTNLRQNVDSAYLPDFYRTIDTKYLGSVDMYVDDMYKETILLEKGKKIYRNRNKVGHDMGVRFGIALQAATGHLRDTMTAVWDSVDYQERLLCDAVIRMESTKPHYSDANFTMRMSYGQVGGYGIGGGDSGYYTTSESMVDKMSRGALQPDYYVSAALLRLMSGGDFGPYRDRHTGAMQLCFLTNNDITGGNSGSPMFNARGELIGLAFDGNWEALATDIYFDKRLSRCIGVDIRYVLFLIDSWGHAGRLIKELR